MNVHASNVLTALMAAAAVLFPTRGPEGTPDGDTKRLERALATVREEGLRGDLGFLAADEMGGRDTPSPGLTFAAPSRLPFRAGRSGHG